MTYISFGFQHRTTIFCFYAMSAYVQIALFYKRSRIKIFYFGSLAVLYIYLEYLNLFDFWYFKFRFYNALAFFPLSSTLGSRLIQHFINIFFFIFEIRCCTFSFLGAFGIHLSSSILRFYFFYYQKFVILYFIFIFIINFSFLFYLHFYFLDYRNFICVSFCNLKTFIAIALQQTMLFSFTFNVFIFFSFFSFIFSYLVIIYNYYYFYTFLFFRRYDYHQLLQIT